MSKKVVIRLGGHVLFHQGIIDVNRVKEVANVVKNLHSKGAIIRIVVGGGNYARDYINVADALGASEFEKDYLAIIITRANAFLFTMALKDYAYPRIPQTLEEILNIDSLTDKIIVCGGLVPGQSTVSVAAIVAEAIKADFIINVTNVDGVYTCDPKVYSDAKLIKKVTTQRLKEILREQKVKAGYYELIDLHAINIIERSKIPLRIVNGNDVNNIIKAFMNEDVGTLVIPGKNNTMKE
ncbi:MAG: UMP kinase [archaeon GBS-70-058]|nr:UMP kinase [Candidatus Culexarchaeum nevadense]